MGAYAAKRHNHSYWLVALQNAFDNCYPLGGAILCRPLDVPPGYDALTEGRFEGVNKDDMVIGSVRTWVANGLKNTRTEADVNLNLERFEEIERDRVRASGMVFIAVCSMAEAFNNWEWLGEQRGDVDDLWPEFPCNKT